MTRDGGIFALSLTFRQIITAVLITPIFVILVLAMINPLWFRDRFFNWTEKVVYRITQWRNYRVYAIYLGTDPTMWHTLKGE
jgi:hypothetical protein